MQQWFIFTFVFVSMATRVFGFSLANPSSFPQHQTGGREVTDVGSLNYTNYSRQADIQDVLSAISSILKSRNLQVCADSHPNETDLFKSLFIVSEKKRLASQVKHSLVLLKERRSPETLADITVLLKSMQRNVDRMAATIAAGDVCLFKAQETVMGVQNLLHRAIDAHWDSLPKPAALHTHS